MQFKTFPSMLSAHIARLADTSSADTAIPITGGHYLTSHMLYVDVHWNWNEQLSKRQVLDTELDWIGII